MKKIRTIFERDWDGDRQLVLDKPHPECGWVFDGDGIATRKLDGTSCLVRDGKLFKRRELKAGQPEPAGFVNVGTVAETGKTIGRVPVGDGPEDKHHRAAFTGVNTWPDGTYELIGPNVQGNPEKQQSNVLIPHGRDLAGPIEGVPRDFASLKSWLDGRDIEGIVFHHPDGRMAKIKLKDFGLKRP